MPIFMDEERKKELVATEGVTLNGEPARIAGYKMPFAVVRQITSEFGVEFAWQTVEHIVMNKEGKFRA